MVDVSVSRDELVAQLRMVVAVCALIPAEALEAHIDEARASKATWDAVGFAVDPTGYRDYLSNEGDKRAKSQLEITELILRIGQLAREHDDSVRSHSK